MAELFEDIFKTKPYPTETSAAEAGYRAFAGKTMAYSSPAGGPDLDEGQLKTVAYQPEAPIVKRTISHNLGVGDVVELNSIKYEILSLLSDEGKTAEAVIYKVKDKSDRIFGLKLYYEFNDENLEPNSDTLQRIREIGGKDILFLFDFGTGPNKYLQKHCFEVMDFAAGGDLLTVENLQKKYSPVFIQNTVISGIHNGLHALHKQKIYHCDLKPQNVFYLDEEQSKIVIGDYGSAKSFEISSDKELSYTTLTKGTEFYLAPEQAFGIVSEKNDYYSLGMIVLHLLYPGQVNRQNLRRIFERRTKGLPIIDYEEKYELLNHLIEGLTLQDYNSRWGEQEVSAWLAGKEVNVNYGALGEKQHLLIGDQLIKTTKDLSAYIESDSRFFDDLIEDREGYSQLLAWIKNLQGDQNMKHFDAMVSHYKKYFGIEYVKEAMLFYFNPAHKVSIGMETFGFTAEPLLEQLSTEYFEKMDELWKISDFESMQLYFFKFEFALRRLRVKASREAITYIDKTFEATAAILGTSYNPDFTELKASLFIHLKNKHLPEIFYHFDRSRSFMDLRREGYSTWFEVCEYLKTNPPRHANDFLQIEKSTFLKHSSKEEFVEFVEFSDDVLEFLLANDVDFDLLIGLISKYSQRKLNVAFVREVLLQYRKCSQGIIREVILRLINPELPVKIMGANIFLYQPGDFHHKVEDFFVSLDQARMSAPFDQVEQAFFSFEFTLMQLAKNDKLVGKTLVGPLFEKINNILHANLPDIDRLKASFYLEIDHKKLLDILYIFHPSRVFCTHDGKFLKTVEELGFYYLQNPDQFANELSQIEREAFLRKSGNRGSINLNYEDFIIKIFQAHTSFDVIIKEIVFDEIIANEATFYYDYVVDIDEFLNSEDVDSAMKKESHSLQSLTVQRKPFTTDEGLYDNFVSGLQHKYVFGKLSAATRGSFDDALHKGKRMDFMESFSLIPRYLIYLFPAFAVVFLSLSYLLDNSMFKDISYSISPTLHLVSVRMGTAHFGTLLFVAYFLNFLLSLFLLLPVLSLRRKTDRYEYFMQYHGSLLSRLTLIMLFAPFLFTALYYLLNLTFGDLFFTDPYSGFEMSTIQLSISLYNIFMFYQTMKVIGAFFKVSKKIRILPLIISVLLYLMLAYFTIVNQNLQFI